MAMRSKLCGCLTRSKSTLDGGVGVGERRDLIGNQDPVLHHVVIASVPAAIRVRSRSGPQQVPCELLDRPRSDLT